MDWLLVAVSGLVVGFLIHLSLPRLARLKEKSRPFRRPWVEILTALLFLLVHTRLGWDAAVLKWYLFTALLVAITAADMLAKIIPDRVSYPGTALGVIVSAGWPTDICGFLHQPDLLTAVGLGPGALGGLLLSVAGAVVAFVLFESVRRVMSALAGMQVMGMGDSKLLMMCGAFLGPEMVVFSLLPGIFAGLILGIIYTRIFKSPHFPFGPALGLGALLTLLFCDQMVAGLLAVLDWMRDLDGPAIWIMQIVLLGTAVALMIRVRRRSARYTEEIEKDYADLDEKSEE